MANKSAPAEHSQHNMSNSLTNNKNVTNRPRPLKKPDGRLQRSAQSRDKIVDALYHLLKLGELNASAAQIAKAAGVSIRTVFRQFDEVDFIYQEISERLTHEIMPIIEQPYQSDDWRERLAEHVDRCAEVYEYCMPFRTAGDSRRLRSQTLQNGHQLWLHRERQQLTDCINGAISVSGLLFAAIESSTSFENWLVLRHNIGLSPKKARAVVLLHLQKLTSD